MDLGKGNNTPQSNGALIGIVAVLTVVLTVGGFIIAQFTPTLFPDQASAEGAQVDELFKVMLGIGGAIFLLVEGALIYSILRFRKRQGDESDGPTVHGNVTLEIIWTSIPAVIVFVLVIYSYQVWTDVRAPKDDELTVYAQGFRFGWAFEYEDPRLAALEEETGEDATGRFNTNELHVYVGQPVRMVMNTQDVIHAFWVPEMRIKQDLLPGRTTEIRFTPQMVDNREASEYPLQYRVVCTELCGSGHGNMWASIFVHESEESYMGWIDAEVDRILNPPEDPALQGFNVLNGGAYGCQSCHVLEEEREGESFAWEGITGPSLEGIADRAGERVPGQTAEEYLFESIYDTDAHLVTGYQNLMNPFQFQDPSMAYYMPKEDSIQIVSFLCTVSDEFTPEEIEENPLCDLENLQSFAEGY